MHVPIPLLTLTLALLCVTGCSEMEVQPVASEAASVPLLPDGTTLGTTFYGSANLAALGQAERALVDDAVASGLGGFTVYVDWVDLEPEPGRYTPDETLGALDALRDLGLRPYVNITVGDIEAYNLPDDLSDGAGGLAEGVALDDPAIVERFGRLLDRLAPELVDRGVFFLGVGNEVDARLDGEYPGERDAYVRFVEAARARVHAVEPRLAVGVALTDQAVRGRTRTFRALRAVSDAVPFNHAPLRPDFFVLDLDAVRANFREALAAYGDGPVLIQELTCPSAESMGASEAWQRGCFERLFAEIEAQPQVRFASVFTFADFDEATCEIVREALFGDELDGLPEAVAERLTDYTCRLGVTRPGGVPKPAWDAVLAAASRSS